MKFKTANKIFSAIATFALLLNSLAVPLTVLAQEVTPSATPTETASPTPDATVAPTDTISPTPDATVTPTETAGPTEVAAATPEETVAPTEIPLDSPTPFPEVASSPTAEASATPVSTPSITTDKADYHPEETATITGKFFQALQNLVLKIFGGSTDDGTYTESSFNITTDVLGGFSFAYLLDSISRPLYTAQVFDATGTQLVQTTFTDPAPPPKPAANLDQCANKTTTCDSTHSSQWQNGNLGQSQAIYKEGDVVPYRTVVSDAVFGNTYTLKIEWDTTQSGKHAEDYLKTFNATEATADPCSGIAGCGSSTTFPIALDPNVSGAGVTQLGGQNFTIYNGTISAVESYVLTGTYAGSSSTSVIIHFQPSASGTVVLAWGGHISTRVDWGAGNSAINISGSPYHMRLIDFTCSTPTNCSSGNQDRSLSAEAVIFPATLTIIKDATPNGSTSFPFTASPSPLTGFSLVDDGTSANTKLFSNILTFQHYLLNETPIPAGWGFDSVSCSHTSDNGGSYTPSTTNVDINMKEGENWTCTYFDSLRTGTLTIIKHVVNDNGGNADANDFNLHVKSTGADVAGSPAVGAESPGTNYTLTGGTYVVSEDTPPTGYTQTGFSGDCDSGGNVTVVAGATKTCTVTNNDDAPALHLRKVVANDNGGAATVADFTLTADGTGANDISGTSPVDSGSGLKADTFALSETNVSGYTASAWVCVGGTQSGSNITVGIGEEATCTITNDDQQAYIVVNKTVINDNGGTAVANDFLLTVDGNSVSDEVAYAVNPGTHTAGETLLAGYTQGTWGGDCNENASVTVALGQTKTCTITNDDQQAYITVVKVVTNDNGGSADPDDFDLTLEGNAVLSSVAVPVNPGTYTAAETLLSGYTFEGFSGDCDSSGDTTVALGESKTCTLTNDDQQAYVIVDKTVINDNGGSAVADDFKLTIDGDPVLDEVAVPVNPGTHTAGETLLPGYTAGAWGGDCNVNASVSIALGQTKTCTITNDDIAPKLHLRKVVVNNNGGTKTVSDFTLTADGAGSNDLSGTSPVDSGATLQADTFALGESAVAGYSSSAWNCVGGTQVGSNITVGIGGEATCTITNDDIPATLTIVKNAVANDCQDFAFSGALGSFALDDDGGVADCQDTNRPNSRTASVSAGLQTVTETEPNQFWVLGGASCVNNNNGGATFPSTLLGTSLSLTLPLAGNVTCTFTNNKLGPTRTLGFWKTHTSFTTSVFGSIGGTLIIGDSLTTHQDPINSTAKLFGAYYSNVAKTSTGPKRLAVDQARIQLAWQLITAKLNCAEFGCPASVLATTAFADTAYAAGSIPLMLLYATQLDTYNNSGDTIVISPAPGKATPKTSQLIANLAFWDAP